MKKVVFVIIITLFSSISFAGNGFVSGYIDSLTIKESGDLFIIFDSAHQNPNGCEIDNKIVVVDSNPLKKEMLSMALSALHAGKKVSAWSVGCISRYNKTFPETATFTVFK